MHDLLCWLGIHAWNWFAMPTRERVCRNCGKRERRVAGEDGWEWCEK